MNMNMNTAAEIVTAFFKGFEEGKVDVDRFFHPDVAYTVIHPDKNETNRAIPWAGHYQGLDAAKGFLGTILQNISVTDIHADKIISEGNDVAVFGRFYYTANSTQNEFFSYFAVNIEVKDGKIFKYHFYEDTFAVAFAFRESGHWTSQFTNIKSKQIPNEQFDNK